MRAQFGPLLYARGITAETSHTRLMVWCRGGEPPVVECAAALSPPKALCAYDGGVFWAWEISVPQTAQDQTIPYAVLGQSHSFTVPARQNAQGFRLAYASCSGSEADEPGLPPYPARNALWAHLAQSHEAAPFHVLVQGGDQIYADSVWRNIRVLKNWKALPRSVQYSAPVDEALFEAVRAYYFECYMHQWAQEPIARVMARIPSLMIWDDHDIFDGWGSWNKRYQASPMYQMIFRAAREAYHLFQAGQAVPEDGLAGFAYRFGPLGVIAPDLRTERTRKIVMGDVGWRKFTHDMEYLQDCKHVVMVSSVPLATAHFSALDPILTGFPSFLARRLPHKWNPKRFADDIHDQWRVPAHRDEWVRMLDTLLSFAEKTKASVSVLSGEIHLGARSTIRRGMVEIVQYIASGIAHKPAHPVIVWACELLSKGTQDLTGGIDIRMERFFPKGRKRYLAARNWLSFEITPQGQTRAIWQAENLPPVTHERG